jgi:Fe-S cluster assembly protein SufD
LTDIYLAPNAVCRYNQVQRESLKATHINATRVWQERDAVFDGFSLTVGGAVTRHNLDIIINGEGGQATLNGLYSVRERQHVDNHTSVDHRFPNGTSNQLYKGILNDQARAVFNGKIFVRPIAQLTNSYQLNKNLILGKDCRVDTKPQLEISADDVKCTHGATVGQLNDEEIFYLRTRAIPRSKAVEMLSHGFVDDILNKIQHPRVREHFQELVKPTLSAVQRLDRDH